MLTSDPQPDHLLLACRDGSLPRTDWTHEAHLAVARVLLDEAGDPDVALGELRGLITSYNARSGLPDDRIICHETITRYYLGAVIALRHLPLDEVVVHPWCARGAPLRHWSRARLDSEAARRSWVPPDLAPLPFDHPVDPITDMSTTTDHTGATP
ncbi:MAG: hypothetical protein R2699_12865 [Acidimicrobiales bacterium]|nr:hypothetical protein [Acidimicrobiales bacterium]MCB1261185.1 hypothetical protein [Acidimicrobiales bacterium]